MKKLITFILSVLFLHIGINAEAQCKIENTYFDVGEDLSYDLYFKYGLINMKAGVSSLRVTSENYKGNNAYKMTLLAESVGAARKFFKLEDTLVCYTTKDLVPLAFLKKAHEGDEHTQEEVSYDYNGKNVNIKTKRVRNNILRFDETLTANSCLYDMVSIVFYARTLDYSNMNPGDVKRVSFLSGRDKENMEIEYHGIEVMQANDKKKYECIKLVLNISSEAFDNKKEAMRVYITNDKNRMPIRLDSKLKIGATQAILKSYKGNKYPVKAQ